MNEFTIQAIAKQDAIADGEWTHSKYLIFREWFMKQFKKRREAVSAFAMFDLMYGHDLPIKNYDDETI